MSRTPRMVGKQTFPRVRRRRIVARETARTGSERDVVANLQPLLPAQKSLGAERERAAHRPSPSGVRVASLRDRRAAHSPSLSPYRCPARGHAKTATAMRRRPARNRVVHCIYQLTRRETPHHGDDAIVAANGMKSEGKRDE